MKEIKFRGKRSDNNEWVYGLFARHKIGNLICPCIQVEHEYDSGDFIEYIEIDGDTLGQFTGLIDMNGKEIYEDDYVKVFDVATGINSEGYVTFGQGSFYITDECYSRYRWIDYQVEIIGDIYDNPDIMSF